METNDSLIQAAFSFEDRKRFTAQCEHDILRSSINSDTDLPATADPWKQRPVDFTMKNFHPNRKKEQNLLSNETNLVPSNNQSTKPARQINSNVMQPFAVSYDRKSNDDQEDKEFLLSRKIRYEKVKRMLNTEQYQNPKPHDFRQYPNIKELGLDEFQTAYDRDPYNLRFHSNRLNTLWLQERKHERVADTQKPLSEMYRALTARPKWDTRLVLPKIAYPNKYAAYTRYRNPNRTVQSAYWERVENRFDQTKKRVNII